MSTPSRSLSPFHLAFPVHDLAAARDFYVTKLGCTMGRSSDRWIDFDFFGHQIVAHQVAKEPSAAANSTNYVDGHGVPVPHFGVVLEWNVWQQFAERLRQENTEFVIAPYIRFLGEPGEQATMFFLDPSGNALEFKAFKDLGNLFAT